jgi:hypothetical protein
MPTPEVVLLSHEDKARRKREQGQPRARCHIGHALSASLVLEVWA